MKTKKMSYSEAIEKVLLDNNYVAPLKTIYREISKYRDLTGETPFNTIQAIVQRDIRFSRVGLGVYALTEFLDKLPQEITPKDKKQTQDSVHSRIEGMLLEIGNIESYDTYSPDKNPVFSNKSLKNIMTLNSIPDFTFPRIIDIIKEIDVLWFNERNFPIFAFEVEVSTTFTNSLSKFSELIDFNMSCFIISDLKKEVKFSKELLKHSFRNLKDNCRFRSFEQVHDLYSNLQSAQRVRDDFFR